MLNITTSMVKWYNPWSRMPEVWTRVGTVGTGDARKKFWANLIEFG